VITHDMKSAYAISDRIAMLFNGRVVEVGTPDEIRRTDNLIVRGFVEGRPEMVEQAEADEEQAEDARAAGGGHPRRGTGHHAGGVHGHGDHGGHGDGHRAHGDGHHGHGPHGRDA
jgi:ABC-type sulfate/molybdate transport systems ATPase subunit